MAGTQLSPRSIEYSTDVIAEPLAEPSVKATMRVRLSVVLGVDITGGFGTPAVTEARIECVTGAGTAELG